MSNEEYKGYGNLEETLQNVEELLEKEGDGSENSDTVEDFVDIAAEYEDSDLEGSEHTIRLGESQGFEAVEGLSNLDNEDVADLDSQDEFLLGEAGGLEDAEGLSNLDDGSEGDLASLDEFPLGEESDIDFGTPLDEVSWSEVYGEDLEEENHIGSGLEESLTDEEKVARLREKSDQLKAEIKATSSSINQLDYRFEDVEGNFVEPRAYEGSYMVDIVPIENIKGVGSMDSQIRQGELEIAILQEDVHRFGLLEPLHVVPTKKIGEKDGRPVYSRYLLLNGRRRLEACINLGYTDIPVLVDSTIPPQLIKVYEAIINNNKEYMFTEKLKYARFLMDTQKNITNDMVENILGWRSGEYLKAQYIEQLKNEYPDIYRSVENKKMTIEQGFKKIEKDIEKAEKEAQGLSQQEIEDDLREKGRDELAELQIEKQQQTVGDRKILDPMIRKAVEVRDRHCQCCGYGKDEEDFMCIFKVHHIIAVQYGGSDSKYNLILLCNNCHDLIHDYEKARFLPSQDTYNRRNDVKRIVVLGNMLKQMKKMGLVTLKSNHQDVWRQVDKGVLSIGKGLLKAGVNLKGEEYFSPSPYERFFEVTADLDLGVGVRGELGDIGWDDAYEEDVEESVEV